jgi:hypothetical protein
VVGSAVYVGKWLKPARKLADEHGDELARRPTWLSSSGLCRAGKLDKSQLGFGERAVVLAVRAPDGDFRGWREISDWAATIAAAVNWEQETSAATELWSRAVILPSPYESSSPLAAGVCRRRATTIPACQAGARPPLGESIAAASSSLRTISHEISEFEFTCRP